ncbi:MAG TPA: methyltransferase [Gammaproteobacteria bacterium]|nr:methyltransferase [Gammaproteobacteria bacterium]
MPARPRRQRRRRPTLAECADRHVLYEEAVQSPEHEIEFLEQTFKRLRGRQPELLREDFCGTANVACTWARRGARNRAIAVDIDPAVLDWGRKHHLLRLRPAVRARVTLLQADVLTVETEPADIVVALNFSYWIFKDRARMRRYFENVRRGLKPDGLFVIDAYGGSDAHRILRERRKCGRFTYVWHQAEYDPVTNHITCHIDFVFSDGSRLPRAYTYHWRLWSLPELRELLAEAGFGRSTVYWQGTDEETGEESDEFNPVERGEADPAWIAYIVAEP